jgi:hypothetical protein
MRVLVGTDAASEGLNLQTLGSLVNLFGRISDVFEDI